MRYSVYLTLASLVLTTGLWAQQDFSADIVTHDPGKPASTPSKMYVTKDKMRFESQQSGHNAAVIINFASQTSDVLMPERKMYMEWAAGQGPGAARTWAFFRPADVENACTEWQKLAWNKSGGECHKVGSDTINGRSTVKYEAKSSSGEISDIWLDNKIVFPIKWQGRNSEGELQNIKEGSQAASLFEIPSDYQKMDMGAMMGRH